MTIQPRPGQDLARHLEHSDEVHLNDALPFAGIELLEGLIAAEIPGIVHKNVDRPQFLLRLLNQPGNLVPTRDVRLDGERLDSFATETGH